MWKVDIRRRITEGLNCLLGCFTPDARTVGRALISRILIGHLFALEIFETNRVTDLDFFVLLDVSLAHLIRIAAAALMLRYVLLPEALLIIYHTYCLKTSFFIN